jgi:serine/threonine protein kinase/Tfp pilus assembly protein PilF
VPDSWVEIDSLLDRALDLPAAERPAFLARLRSTDPELAAEVERLLVGIASAEGFLQSPAVTYAAPLVRTFLEQPQLAPGMRLGTYEVISELGRGGTATVYLAHDHKHQRRVAMKVPHRELASAVSGERFLREIRIAARLQHPHILPLHDSGDSDGVLYYVMPYVEGESLRQRLNRERRLAVDEAVRLTCEVADALSCAHAQGLVHRDIKPENILLSGGHALVADFGIARAIAAGVGERLAETGLASGTPAYMSPEQAAGKPQLDGRSDIYSLGCVLYEMLAGDLTYARSSARGLLARKMADPIPTLRTLRENLPIPVLRAVEKALALIPDDRWATAQEFAAALKGDSALGRIARHRSGIETSAGTRRWLALTGFLAVVGLVGRIANESRSAEPKSLAVLPCETSAADSTQAYVADRWSEELIDKLSKVRDLRVISWLSMRQYHRTAKSSDQIGRELGTAALVRCSVTEGSDSLRFKVQVIDAGHGSLLESRAYTGPLTASAINQVQTDAAGMIASALGVTPSSAERTRVEKQPTRSTEALAAFRLGRHFLGLVEPRKSIAQFKQAIARDSGFAAAYAGLADATLIEGSQHARPTKEYVPSALQAVLKALSIDPELAEAHTLLGDYFLWYNHDWASAESEHQRALRLNPNSAVARMWYGMDLTSVGQPERGVAELEKAVELEPAFPLARIQLISGLRVAGQYQRALAEVQRAFKVDPGNPVVYMHLGLIRLQRGQIDSAVAALEQGVRLGASDADARSRLAHAYGLAGRRDEANRMLKDLMGNPGVDPLHIARVQLGLGNRDKALSWLQRAYQERSWEVITALGGQDPAFHVLRSDPRFVTLRKQAGLEQT